MKRFVNVNDWPLATKLVVVLTLLSVLTLAASTVASSYVAGQRLEAQIGGQLEALAELQGERLGGVLAEQVTLITAARATEAQVVTAVAASNAAYTGSAQEIEANLLALDAEWQAAPETGIPLIQQALNNSTADELRTFVQQLPLHAEIFATDRYGAVVAASDRTSDYYQADEEWWQEAWNDGQGAIYIEPPELDESAGVVAVTFSVPITEADGEVVGVAKDVYNIQALIDEIVEFELGQTGQGYLIDAQGNFVASEDLEAVGAAAPASLLLEGQTYSGKGHDFQVAREGGSTSAIAYAPVTTGGQVPAVDQLGWVVVVEQDRAEALAPLRQIRNVSIGSALVTTLAAVGLAFMLARLLTRQVDEIEKVFRAAAIGELNARAEVFSGDELGRTADGVNALLGQLTDLLAEAEKIASERLAVLENTTDFIGVADMEGQALYINPAGLEMTGHVGMDPTTLSIAELQPPDSVRIIVEEAIPAAIERGTWSGELEFLHADGTLIPVSQVVVAIYDQTGQPVANATVARDIRERRLVEADVSQVVALMVEQAAASAQVAERAASSALEGDQAVRETVAAMESIRDNTQETARRIKRLGEASQEISEVVRLIEELADRTTVLALNASIQAAAAGEAGRGFAVVAEEVQRLAERATGETRRIEDLVKTIQAETNEAAVGIEEATREVVEGSQLAQQAGDRVAELSELVDELASLIQHVAETTAQQTTASLAALAGDRPVSQTQPDGDGYAGPDGDGMLAQSTLAGDGATRT